MIDLGEILEEINVPDLSCPLALQSNTDNPKEKNLIAEQKRHAWDKSVESRCDFSGRMSIYFHLASAFRVKLPVYVAAVTRPFSSRGSVGHWAMSPLKV